MFYYKFCTKKGIFTSVLDTKFQLNLTKGWINLYYLVVEANGIMTFDIKPTYKFQLNQTKGLIDRCYPVSEAAGSLKVKHEFITNFDFSPTYKISAQLD